MSTPPSSQSPLSPQGQLSSARLMSLVRAAVRARLPEIDPTLNLDIEGLDKTTLLRLLLERQGAAAVVGVGLALAELPAHPVIDAIVRGRTALEVLERWSRLERFGHTRHRTRAQQRDTPRRIDVEHVALDGGWIDPVHDLFMWGLLVALLKRAGFSNVSAYLGTVPIIVDGTAVEKSSIPKATSVVTLRWGEDRRAPGEDVGDDAPGRTIRTVEDAIGSDLLRNWRLSDVAPQLRLSVRSLQRRLTAEGTTFSQTLHRARIDAACALMNDRRLSLGEIAFCVGFSDQAHFSRLFHRYLDVPPSAYRELLSSP